LKRGSQANIRQGRKREEKLKKEIKKFKHDLGGSHRTEGGKRGTSGKKAGTGGETLLKCKGNQKKRNIGRKSSTRGRFLMRTRTLLKRLKGSLREDRWGECKKNSRNQKW